MRNVLGLFLVIGMLAGFIWIFNQSDKMNRKEESSRRALEIEREKDRLDELQSEWSRDINLAIDETNEPCNGVFFRPVDPPEGLIDQKARLIILGEDVGYGTFDSSAYELRAHGDKVELWSVGEEPQGDPGVKFGEKYNRDSKFCRDQAQKKK